MSNLREPHLEVTQEAGLAVPVGRPIVGGGADSQEAWWRQPLTLRAGLALAVIYANFVAQLPYFMHVYYARTRALPATRPALEMVAVLVLLVAGSALLFMRRKLGWVLLLIFCALDFLFYLWTIVGSAIMGYGWFFQLANTDPLLRVVFAIGYLNFAAAGYLLWLLVAHRRDFLPQQ